MKVILLQDVAKVGKRFDVAEVPDGYGQNMLVPKGMAQVATPENLKRVLARKAMADASATQTSEAFTNAVAALKDNVVEVKVEANQQGHLFEALKPAAIVAALASQEIAVTEDQVVVATAIKETGEHTIELVAGDQKHTFKISVTA